jgi:hypothetical protein
MPRFLSDSEILQAKETGCLHLSYRRLRIVPPEIFAQLPSLKRLDLGCNRLIELDPRIAELSQLEELWLNENPLENLPTGLDQNRKLRVLDLRKTRLRRLPNELGRLKQIHSIDLEGTKLKPKQWSPYTEGGTSKLMAHLHMRDQRKQAKLKMLQRMRESVYRELWDVPGGQEQIMLLIKEVFLCFEDLEDIKNLIRNAERLFPDDIEDVDILPGNVGRGLVDIELLGIIQHPTLFHPDLVSAANRRAKYLGHETGKRTKQDVMDQMSNDAAMENGSRFQRSNPFERLLSYLGREGNKHHAKESLRLVRRDGKEKSECVCFS